jgi:hypothetical protein
VGADASFEGVHGPEPVEPRDPGRPDAPGSGRTMHLLPVVNWPKRMTVGKRHLVAVNLALVTSDLEPAAWPLPEEERVYTCALDGGADFDLWAVDDATVILHRFGGSYGPAEFVVTPQDKPGERSIWLTILNQGGIPIGEHALPVEVLAGEKAQTGDGGVGATVTDDLDEPDEDEFDDLDWEEDLLVGLNGVGDDLAAAETVSVGIPIRELPDARPSQVAPTVPDLPYLDEDSRSTEELEAAATRRDLETARRAESPVPRRRDGARLATRLGEFYNVAGLRREDSGRLLGEMIPLFQPGSVRGDTATFTACCSASDEHGTVFAVVGTRTGRPDGTARPRSIQSAKIPPGVYRVTAELLPPDLGHVRFHGLPAEPRDDPRRWEEIVATVPRSVPAGGPAHLIIAIEVSAPDHSLVYRRLDAAQRLIQHVATEARDLVRYSIITYGPHYIHLGNRDFPEVRTTRVPWAGTADEALARLYRLSGYAPAPVGYERAAQLECVLTDLEAGLTGEQGRPVIVTVGARPPHPPRVDPATGIIRCHRRNDWREPMIRLRTRYAGIKFGAIRETGPADQLWALLGADALAGDDLYAPRFAQSLGLTSATARPTAPPIALPLLAA